jgi:signal recognition particle subunit SRP72
MSRPPTWPILTDLQSIPDLSTRKIAQNNLLVASSKPSNHFLSHKLFHSTPAVPESDKLFTFQSRPYASNAKSIDLQAFKFEGVAESTAKAISRKNTPTTSADVTTLAVLNAAAHGRNQTGSAALMHILPELEKRPNDVGLIITVVQMYMLTGNITSATSLLETFLKRLDDSISENDQDVRFSPGLVAILIGLYSVQGRRAHIKQELAKAAVYWRHKSKAPQSLLQAAGAALLENPSSKDDVLTAGEIFAKLHEQSPHDKSVLAGLVASKATQQHDEISSELSKLTPVPDLIRGVDVAALEKAGIPQSSNALAIAQQISSRKRPADGAQSKPKRIRKSRLPKDYEPGKTPDPERWLPLRDRSNYRPKGKKKGKKDGGDRTQGGVVADDVGVKDTTTKTQSTVIGAGNTNKKKKGKGKK